MIGPHYTFLLSAAITLAAPILKVRTVTSLNQAAFEEAHQRDDSATRAFSSTQIKTSDGQCLFVDELSGDFRANLTPVQVAACNGSTSQLWDIITAGKHDDQNGTMLVVSTLTQACLNFDPRRAAGNQVLLFSCGGRADGSGQVTNSQLFAFTGGAGPLSLEPKNAAGTCLAVTSANVLDNEACSPGDANQSFTFGSSSSASPVSTPTSASTAGLPESAATSSDVSAACGVTTVTVTRRPSSSTTIEPEITAASLSSSSGPAIVSSTATSQADANPTTAVAVSRAGGVLQPSAAAEANRRDNTATRALSSVSVKAANGQCLFINPTAGDFRENLIPVQLQDCTGSAGEKFDFITAGVHNNVANSTLVVSSLTQGCLNFDPRRAAGDTVLMFSCGGRGDGSGQVTNSQLFPFTAGESSFTLAPENQNGAKCLVPSNGKLDVAACSGDASQVFTIQT